MEVRIRFSEMNGTLLQGVENRNIRQRWLVPGNILE